jgi:hypothetical protein
MIEANSRAPHDRKAGGVDGGQLVLIRASKIFQRLLQVAQLAWKKKAQWQRSALMTRKEPLSIGWSEARYPGETRAAVVEQNEDKHLTRDESLSPIVP